MNTRVLARIALLLLLIHAGLVASFKWPKFGRKQKEEKVRPPGASPKTKLSKGALIKNLILLATKFDIKEYRSPSTIRGILRNGFVPTIPGTFWCGKGDISLDHETLGKKFQTDACCKEHDFCSDIMLGHTSKNGLINTASFTRLHCDCDGVFFDCLKGVYDGIAKLVGKMYFNVIQTPCYKEEYPVLGCARKSRKYKKCIEYELDQSGNKTYQWFDNPEF